tara:strand:- start:534 stop:668 length:135 start_codon:yes stop_codon:yes gene_type:complete
MQKSSKQIREAQTTKIAQITRNSTNKAINYLNPLKIIISCQIKK